MKVLLYQKPSDIWLQLLHNTLSMHAEVELHCGTEVDSSVIAAADVIICGKPDRRLLEQASALKLLLVPIAGITHLPLDLISQRGIRVGNTHANADVVAERTLALILAFYGRIIEFHNDLRNRKWHGFWSGQGLGDSWESIYDKRVAVLGTGAIGSALARLLRVFNCNLTGFRRRQEQHDTPAFDRIVYDPDEAISGAEIVVIALPGSPETIGFVDARRLDAMRGALLVNVGRGSIVDEEALYNACRSGTLRGAAIDTWYTYPEHGTVSPPSRFPFHTLDNVVLSPHTAGYTRRSALRSTHETIENLQRYLRDGSLLHEADPTAGY